MKDDKIYIHMLWLIVVLFFGIIYIGLSCKQIILEQQIQINEITLERDLYKNLVEVKKDDN